MPDSPIPPQDSQDVDATSQNRVDPPPPIQSEALLRGHQEILIQHGEDIYRLRLTRNGKLILCK